MGVVRSRFEILREALQKAGPYLLIELMLPGGSLVAAMLYLYRRKYAKALSAREPFMRLTRPFLACVLAVACVSLAGCGGAALLREARPLESFTSLAAGRDERIVASIEAVIVPHGAGAWAGNAEWDEYLIRIRSLSDERVEIRGIAIFDALDHRIEPRSDRGDLVDGTRETERRYEQAGKVVLNRGVNHRGRPPIEAAALVMANPVAGVIGIGRHGNNA